jgi:arabinofuranosyltransferase
MSSTPREDASVHLLLLLAGLALAIVVVRQAWVCDDAFITLRSVKQFVHGNGLVWNAGERVQAFTHPLWLFVLTPFYWVTREPFYTPIVVSLITTCLAMVLVARPIAISPLSALAAFAVLLSSKAFVDYSTSGLENPLTHLLLAAFFAVYFRQGASANSRLSKLAWIAGLAALNRLDTLLIFAPALIEAARTVPLRRALATIALGFTPMLAWECFSIVYYGAPFPNTAYAKLGADIERSELVRQGLAYFESTLDLDPSTLIAIALGLVLALRRRARGDVALCAGALLYLAYVVCIGGDFMSGRFLAAPLVCMAISIARQPLAPGAFSLAVPAAILFFGLSSPLAPLRIDRSNPHRDQMIDLSGISDERAYYTENASVLSDTRAVPAPRHWVRPGSPDERKVLVLTNVGAAGYFENDSTHIVDAYALADPLLARLPMAYQGDWRVGHFKRAIPEGYVETLRTGTNVIADRNLARYYDELATITRGPIFSAERWRAIWRLNTGALDELVDRDAYRFASHQDVDATEIATPFAEGSPNDAPGVHALHVNEALTVHFATAQHARGVLISADYNDHYDVLFARGRTSLGKRNLGQSNIRGKDPGLRTGWIDVPDEASDVGFDTLRIIPWGGDGHPAVGCVTLVP